ncbi:hypothetical protein U1Q18_031170 [Sarracenia purpurea var. burkii]
MKNIEGDRKREIEGRTAEKKGEKRRRRRGEKVVAPPSAPPSACVAAIGKGREEERDMENHGATIDLRFLLNVPTRYFRNTIGPPSVIRITFHKSTTALLCETSSDAAM